MAAIASYAQLSAYHQCSASDITREGNDILEMLFPSVGILEYGSFQLSLFFLTTSCGNKMLILADAPAFMDLRNSCDRMRELLPVFFDCSQRACSPELTQAIRDHGDQLQNTPHLVALQIEADTRNGLSRLFSSCSRSEHPHALLAQIIRGEKERAYIGGYQISKVADSWTAPLTNPAWNGLAFEQNDCIIRTWLHEANPHALQRAREDAQRAIDQTNERLSEKNRQIQQHQIAGRFQGDLKKRLKKEVQDIIVVLTEQQNYLSYLTAQTVNSAAQTTLQCSIRMQVDSREKLELLQRYVCQEIVTLIDQALTDVSWEALQINTTVIENFIRQKCNAFEAKLSVLVENSGTTQLMTDWATFATNTFPEKQQWLKETFPDFRSHQAGEVLLSEEELTRAWKRSLQEKLQWINDFLHRADEELKRLEHFSFTSIDIRIFTEHRQRMIQVLKQTDEMTYKLGLQLSEKYEERNCIRNALRFSTCVHLVKRVTTTGHVYFGVTRPPANIQERPDPNSALNEVHIPIFTPPSLRQRQQPRAPETKGMSWKWVITAALIPSIWVAINYFNRNTGDFS